MVLEKQVLKELQEILGLENVNDGEVITNAYSYNWCTEIVNYMEGEEPIPFSVIPKAVTLPSSSEEVQKIVKLCNKYGLQFKAQSTGLGPWNQPSSENCIILDLRRMNKIIKIDEKNLYAVVEPYVSGAQLQVEAMKYDLTVHMPGAGPQVSPLASATSMNGPGFTAPYTGHSARNVLGVEWVLPDGEIIKLGSTGMNHNPDWYNGDGPGPSLRGIMRGWAGAKSGIGIFTKVAIKLVPYPCSTQFELKGYSPNYNFKIPDFMRLYVMDCRSYNYLEKVILRIEEEEISFMCSHLSGYGLAAIFSNNFESMMDKMAIASLKIPLVVLITARTKREFDYKQKVMEMLLDDLKLKNIIGTKYTPNSIFYAEALRSNLGLHGFIATGAFQSAKGQCDTASLCLKTTKKGIPLKKKYIKKGVIGNEFGEGVWMTSYESGHYFHVESLTLFDQTEEESVKGMGEFMDENYQFDLIKHLGAPFFVEGDRIHDMFGPYMMDYHKWLRKIKKEFDPNGIADSGFYISSKSEK
ncbi:MAG: FAD-binding oxidoreductase [Promethearchaeota archaeon]